MARTRRTVSRRRPMRRRRERADWVYRPDLFDQIGAQIESLGTYTPVSKTVGKGVENLSNFVLYDSQNRLSGMLNISPVTRDALPRAARAEGRGPLVLGCDGFVDLTTTTWGIGNILHFGLRAVVIEQDPASGFAFIAPTYSMWQQSTFNADQIAIWRNSGNIAHEVRFVRQFSTGAEQQRWMVPFRFRTRRRLKPYQAFMLLVEFADYGLSSVGGVIRPFIRTLVSDAGHD